MKFINKMDSTGYRTGLGYRGYAVMLEASWADIWWFPKFERPGPHIIRFGWGIFALSFGYGKTYPTWSTQS
jgi:hypothetical protein